MADDLTERPAWLTGSSRLARALAALPGEPVVTGELPLAVVDTVVRSIKRRRHPLVHPVAAG